MMVYPLDVNEFRQWLIEQSGEVGKARSSCDCPLARFLQAKTDEMYEVTDYLYSPNWRTHASLPVWASRFVRALDIWYIDADGVGQPVPPDVALALLEVCLAVEEGS